MRLFFLVFLFTTSQLMAFGKLNQIDSISNYKNEFSLGFSHSYSTRFFPIRSENILKLNRLKLFSINYMRSFSKFFSANMGFDYHYDKRMRFMPTNGFLLILEPAEIRVLKFNLGCYSFFPIIKSRFKPSQKNNGNFPLIFIRIGINYFRSFVIFQTQLPSGVFELNFWDSNNFFELEKRLYVRFFNDYALFISSKISQDRKYGLLVWNEEFVPLNSFGIGISFFGL